MKHVNRLHTLTRWPENPAERAALATLDVEYCIAMGRILFPHLQGAVPKELAKVWDKAIKEQGMFETWN